MNIQQLLILTTIEKHLKKTCSMKNSSLTPPHQNPAKIECWENVPFSLALSACKFHNCTAKMNSTYWHLSVCNSHKVVVSIQHYGKMVFVLFPNNSNLVGTTHSLSYILVNLGVVCICNSIVFLFHFTLLRCRAVLCPCNGGETDSRLFLVWTLELAAIHPKRPLFTNF